VYKEFCFCFTGFTCPTENLIQYFCCGTDTYRYCCPPDSDSFGTKFYTDSNYVLDHSQGHDNTLANEISSSLAKNRKLINKQFEQFQRYFFPVFIFSTTILFLVGIALWFWLYKHKAFYSLGDDDLTESRTSDPIHIDSIQRTRENTNLTIERTSRTSLHPTAIV
jgi:hypothetical protein